ncbi:TPA: N-acetylmuramoyl-L-alanine amidase [Pasteurella multocida]|nr:N-acetylmuramoyl-L-alanine amidase [Pasteurella multocida]
MSIQKIIIHCAATPNGVRLAKRGKTASEIIDAWHLDRGFAREINNKIYFNRHLQAIGYHFVIDTDGTLTSGRKVGEQGAHCRGQNRNSIGICLVGTDRFTIAQWHALANLVRELAHKYPDATLHGHREFAPKICPGFDVMEWVDNDCQPLVEHVIMELENE